MRTEPIPFISSAYKDQVRAWSSQDICNWIPSAAEMPGSTTQQRAVTAPGLKPYAEFGSGQVRGIYNCNENIFVVVGSQLFQISNTGVAIPRGVIPGVQRVRFAHNQITGGSELVIVNGYSGYIYNTVTLSLSKISDESFPGSLDVVFIDNYFVHIEPQRRFAFSSGLANGNSYNDFDRFTSEVKPDLLVGMIETNNELLLFSEKSAEFFENTGAANQPFRSKRIYMNRGCAGRDTINLTDNTVFWLGDDGCFYRLDGYHPVRISTRPIEEAIRGLNWYQAFSFVWNDSGHSVVYWTFPDGLTFGFDAATHMWHRRSSKGLSRWRVNCMATWDDKWLAGDFQTGRIWLVDWDYHYEGDQEIEREMTAPVIRDNQNRVIMPRLEVIMDAGNDLTDIVSFPTQPNAPVISGNAPNGYVGELWGPFSYSVTSGTPPYKFSVYSGSLPSGFPNLTYNGTIPSSTPAVATDSEFIIRVTDKNGLYSQITDSIDIIDTIVIPPQLPDWRYLQVVASDHTDYSSPSFDDSSWAIGTAPFGSWEDGYGPDQIAIGAPNGLTLPTVFDPRFATPFATVWTTNTRLWVRRVVNLPSLPVNPISVILYIEDHCNFYVNGTLIFSTPPNLEAGNGQVFVIPSSSFVEGDNLLAFQCNDEAPLPGASVVYFDMLVEV